MSTNLYGYVVKSIDELKNDISARTNTRMDKNGQACALIRLNLPTFNKLTFGNMVVGEVSHLPGEYVLYLSPGTNQLTYTCKGIESTIDFSDYNIDIEGKKTYRIVLKDEKASSAGTTIAYITANYDNQIILIDGIPMGQTPVLIESIEPGKHTISVPNINNITMNDTIVNFVADMENKVELSLQKKAPEFVEIHEIYSEETNAIFWGLNEKGINGKIGLFDYTGKMVIPAQYDYIGFKNYGDTDTYIVGVNNPECEDIYGLNKYLYGLYSEKRGEVLPCIYDDIYKLKWGYEIIKDNKVGFADENGRIISPIEFGRVNFDPIKGTKESWYAVVVKEIEPKNWKYGVINNRGETIIPFKYKEIKINIDRKSGKPNFIAKNNLGWTGVLDINNDWIVEPEYYELRPAHRSDLFIFEVHYRGGGQREGFIDIYGNKKYLPDGYSDLEYAWKNLYTAYRKDYGYGVFDSDFNLLSPSYYEEGPHVSSIVGQNELLWNVGNSASLYYLPDIKEYVGNANGHFIVLGEMGDIVINEKGKAVLNGQRQGFKEISLEGWEPNGNLDYNKATFFKVTGKDDTVGIYDVNGNVVVPIGKYAEANRFCDGDEVYFYLKKKDGEGLFTDSRQNVIFTIPKDDKLFVHAVKDGLVLLLSDSIFDGYPYIYSWGSNAMIYTNTKGEILFTIPAIEDRKDVAASETEENDNNPSENTKEENESYNISMFDYGFVNLIHDDPITDGLGMVRIGNRCGLINKNGTFVLPLIYTAITPFLNGVTFVRDQNGKWHKKYLKDLKSQRS